MDHHRKARQTREMLTAHEILNAPRCQRGFVKGGTTQSNLIKQVGTHIVGVRLSHAHKGG